MNKFKIVIKGNDEGIVIKTKGEDIPIIASIMMFVCDCAIDSDISKKEFLKKCEKTYEICEKERECEK